MSSDIDDSLVFLLLGKPGIGKSTLVNGLVGSNVAKVQKGISQHGVTRDVESFVAVLERVKVIVWDTPGLLDPEIDSNITLRKVKEICDDVDIVLFCINMNTNRVYDDGDESTMIKMITEILGENIWKKTLITLVQANLLITRLWFDDSKGVKKNFEQNIKDWKKLIGNKIPSLREVKAVPVGHRARPTLFEDEKKLWLSEFWAEAYNKLPERKQPAFSQVNRKRLVVYDDTPASTDGASSSQMSCIAASDPDSSPTFQKRALHDEITERNVSYDKTRRRVMSESNVFPPEIRPISKRSVNNPKRISADIGDFSPGELGPGDLSTDEEKTVQCFVGEISTDEDEIINSPSSKLVSETIKTHADSVNTRPMSMDISSENQSETQLIQNQPTNPKISSELSFEPTDSAVVNSRSHNDTLGECKKQADVKKIDKERFSIFYSPDQEEQKTKKPPPTLPKPKKLSIEFRQPPPPRKSIEVGKLSKERLSSVNIIKPANPQPPQASNSQASLLSGPATIASEIVSECDNLESTPSSKMAKAPDQTKITTEESHKAKNITKEPSTVKGIIEESPMPTIELSISVEPTIILRNDLPDQPIVIPKSFFTRMKDTFKKIWNKFFS